VQPAGLFGMGMDVDGDDIIDVGERQFGHCFRPGSLILQIA
jgi:hypothetical protein